MVAARAPIAKEIKPLSQVAAVIVVYHEPVHLYGEDADTPDVVPRVDVAHVNDVKYD